MDRFFELQSVGQCFPLAARKPDQSYDSLDVDSWIDTFLLESAYPQIYARREQMWEADSFLIHAYSRVSRF